ncbi:hypothetical protein [Ostreiculturibacter nitratireducens]|uniref:hypothetical protein n=1 Tax=Ostreiculturibacter nitratireducens TaxID=3075226 RepID=UPI0031B5E3D2
MRRQEGSALGKHGVVVTLIYLLMVFGLVCVFWEKFATLPPNAWGDFLAGSVGPLALAWVVLGFFLQGQELRNSVEALKLQTQELRASVEAQKEVAEANRNQLSLNERSRSEALWLETRKAELDARNFLDEIGRLLPKALTSRKAILAAVSSVNSGAMAEYELRLGSLTQESDQIRGILEKEFSNNVAPKPEPDVRLSALAYDLRYQTLRIKNEIIADLEADDERRSVVRAKQGKGLPRER